VRDSRWVEEEEETKRKSWAESGSRWSWQEEESTAHTSNLSVSKPQNETRPSRTYETTTMKCGNNACLLTLPCTTHLFLSSNRPRSLSLSLEQGGGCCCYCCLSVFESRRCRPCMYVCMYVFINETVFVCVCAVYLSRRATHKHSGKHKYILTNAASAETEIFTSYGPRRGPKRRKLRQRLKTQP